jgi:glycosyltransferase involved in cell wall biosynthesis
MEYWPPVSIIVPTRNEERDIKNTLDRLVALTYPWKEIIVVDDSTDRTADVVRMYESSGMRLISGIGRGRCAARNLGIQNANGEVVVILNADVLLPADFIERILAHYREGADYVLVESKVVNPESVYARFVQAQGEAAYRNADWIEWTEGFSCRKDCALAIGLFPELPFTQVSGEDGFFGLQLNKRGNRKVIDRSIVVSHVGPCHFREFWQQRMERNMPFAKSLLEGYGMGARLVAWAVGRTAVHLGRAIVVLPEVWTALRLCRFSPRGVRDLVAFWFLSTVERVACVVATWSGLVKLWRYGRGINGLFKGR